MWVYDGNRFSTVAAINGEVAIQRQHLARIVQLGHTNETRIRQRCRHVIVAGKQGAHSTHLVSKRHPDPHHTAFHQRQRTAGVKSCAGKQKASFSHHRLAGNEGARMAGKLHLCPFVVLVALAMQRHPRASIQNDVSAHTLPNPSKYRGLDDKSGGAPRKHPTKSPANSNAEGVAGSTLRCWMYAARARRTNSDLLIRACSLIFSNACSKSGESLTLKVFMQAMLQRK